MYWLFLNILWFASSFSDLRLRCQNYNEKQNWEGQDFILHVCDTT